MPLPKKQPSIWSVNDRFPSQQTMINHLLSFCRPWLTLLYTLERQGPQQAWIQSVQHCRPHYNALINCKAKFDETVETALSLGVDPRRGDQTVRGTVILPHGTGKSVALNLCPSMSQASFFKALSGKEATPMPSAPVVMMPQAPLSSVQPPASAKPMSWVPLASQASYGVTLPPQSLSALSAPDERDSFWLEKQVCSQLPLSLRAPAYCSDLFPL